MSKRNRKNTIHIKRKNYKSLDKNKTIKIGGEGTATQKIKLTGIKQTLRNIEQTLYNIDVFNAQNVLEAENVLEQLIELLERVWNLLEDVTEDVKNKIRIDLIVVNSDYSTEYDNLRIYNRNQERWLMDGGTIGDLIYKNKKLIDNLIDLLDGNINEDESIARFVVNINSYKIKFDEYVKHDRSLDLDEINKLLLENPSDPVEKRSYRINLRKLTDKFARAQQRLKAQQLA